MDATPAPSATSGSNRDGELHFSSLYPDVNIPEIPYHLFFLDSISKRNQNATALVDGIDGRTLTYGQLKDGITRLSIGLDSIGLEKSEVFATIAPNFPEFAVVFHAVLHVGAINTTINPQFTATEICKQLNHCTARHLLTVPHLLDKVLEVKSQSPTVNKIIVFSHEKPRDLPLDCIWYYDLLAQGTDTSLLPKILWNPKRDIAVLPYSSGSTGHQKGVMLSHYNLVANIQQLKVVEDLTATDVLVGVLPFFHIYGMQVIMNYGLFCGATVVTMPKYSFEDFLSVCSSKQVTRGYLVPPIILQLAKDPRVDKYDLSHLKVINSGAAHLGKDTQEMCSKRLSVVLKQGYGLTETSPTTHTFADHQKIELASIGGVVPNTQCKIIDPVTSVPLPRNCQGEMCIRGPQVMLGYLNDPKATQNAIDSEGYFHTGDIGYVNDDGLYFVVDRVKELIQVKGYQVAPAELEDLLLSHPSIKDAAVIGLPDEANGEIPKAFVVLEREMSEQEVMDFVADKVVPYKMIKKVEFVKDIPKSTSGKILRRVLLQIELSKSKL